MLLDIFCGLVTIICGLFVAAYCVAVINIICWLIDEFFDRR